MLQIVTKRYFQEAAGIRRTLHRDVLFTNTMALDARAIQLPVGMLRPSTAARSISTVSVEIEEHLETDDSTGPVGRISTGGIELFDDLAALLSFGLNAIFTRDYDLVRRLVPAVQGSQTQASRLFGQTFEVSRYVPPQDWDRCWTLMSQLLDLRRDHYEAAMRAIKRIVGATQRAADDPTLAYVDIVAALESLSSGTEGLAITWAQHPAYQRNLIDRALDGLGAVAADRVRVAVMEADRLGARARYQAFVETNVAPSYFRSEAADIKRPVRAADLSRCVARAYELRSRNVHALQALRDEAWILGRDTETVAPADDQLMLTHVGLLRLARHVIANYIATAPTGVDQVFNWRAALPGQLVMPVAPQYWVWQADGFDQKSVGRYFTGFVEHVVNLVAGTESGLPDMRAVLAKVESIVPGLHRDSDPRAMMLTIYVAWHALTASENARPAAEAFINKHDDLIDAPGLPAFFLALLLGESPLWTVEQWVELADGRRAERARPKHLSMPACLDAALQASTAEELRKASRIDEAQAHANRAIGELPGNPRLIAWETALGTSDPIQLDVRSIVFPPKTDARESNSVASQSPQSSG